MKNYAYEKSENYPHLARLLEPYMGAQLLPIDDARLIVAAPRMLAALQYIIEQTVDGGKINSIARAAIAQVTQPQGE